MVIHGHPLVAMNKWQLNSSMADSAMWVTLRWIPETELTREACVELAGLPTPLTSHPLPSSPSTFPYLSQLRVILLDT